MLRLIRFWQRGGQDLLLLLRALRHPARPVWVWPVALLIGFYALEPANFALPILGITDDLILLPLMLKVIATFLPRDIQVKRSQNNKIS